MKTLRELRALETNKDAGEFAMLARYILRHGGNFSQACRAAEKDSLDHQRGLTPRLVQILRQSDGSSISRATLHKAAQTPLSLGSSAFQDLSAISAGFISSLASGGVFDRILADGAMAEIPLMGGTVGAVSISANSYQVLEGQMKPISKLSLTGSQATPTKALAAVIISQELARMSGANALIQNELRTAAIVASDSVFINAMIANVVPATSYGSNANAIRQDIEYLLRVVGGKANSRVYLITTPAIARTLSQINSSGEPAFPDLGPFGGEVSPGLPVLISDAVPVGYLICLDASRVAASGGEIVLDEVKEATVHLDDAPDSPPTAVTNFQSLWQLNLTGLRIERWMLATKLSTSACAIINNVNSYVTGAGSP